MGDACVHPGKCLGDPTAGRMPTRSAFMTEHHPTGPDEPALAQPASGAGPRPSVADGQASLDGLPPPPPLSPVPGASVADEGSARRQRKAAPWLSNGRAGWIVAAALLCAVV